MPIIPEQSEPKKRRAPWWVLVFAMVTLFAAGLFVWSWFRPLRLQIGNSRLHAAAYYGARGLRPGWYRLPDGWQFIVYLPDGYGFYGVFYSERSN